MAERSQDLEFKVGNSTQGPIIYQCPNPCYNDTPEDRSDWYKTHARRDIETGHFRCQKYLLESEHGKQPICDQITNNNRRLPTTQEA